MTPEEQQKINKELADAADKLVKQVLAAAEAVAAAAAAQNKNSEGS